MNKVLAALAFLALASANVHDRAFYEEKFFEWLSEHKVEANSGSHFVHMLQNFANNHDFIEAHNAGSHSYTVGHNKFSHMNIDEWREYVHMGLNRPSLRKQPASIHTAPADVSSLPDSVDWVSAGAVSGVKDQGQCGSCWSFSTTGALEGAYRLANPKDSSASFSEQHLVDCDLVTNGGNDLGCKGGLMDSAFDWIQGNGYICSESEYPYESGTTKKAGTCSQSSCVKNANTAPKSHTDVATNSDTALMSALAQQPVSVAIEADKTSFQLYKSGVYSDPACGTTLDHGVLAVGYGTQDGQNYWNVKNSWGTTWGDAGYIKMARGVSGAGQCGILSGPPSFPNMK
jgi:C1A family cysteine protease